MDGVLLLVAWLVGGVHQMMCKGDVVGRGEEGWRRGEWGENRGGSGGVVGEERGGRGEGHLIAPNFVVNTFALIDPSGAPILRYNKSHLFPSVEANVQPGPGTLPVVDIPLGRLSVAVWFDMQFPALICQGGRQQVDILLQPSWTWGTVAVPQPWQTVLPLLIRLPHFPSTLAILRVDILLQPSWTWGAIGHMTFETDAVRAAENGLTLLRCSSIGVSGGVSPYYRTLAARCVLLVLWT
ncbi:unnamed protein product [Closterium sp. NIES-65]|nr:unnamed protein product [Closterium sp. NIES-65]